MCLLRKILKIASEEIISLILKQAFHKKVIRKGNTYEIPSLILIRYIPMRHRRTVHLNLKEVK